MNGGSTTAPARRSALSLHQIPAGAKVPDSVNAVIETPMNSRSRYRYDEELGVFRIVAHLSPGTAYPADYGFVPSTVAQDGRPLDIFVLTDEPTFPGCVVDCRPVGVLDLEDERGQVDHKVLAVPLHNPRYQAMQCLADLPAGVTDRIRAFFLANPLVSGKKEDVAGWADRERAGKLVFLAWEGFL